jgi:hypothetical protein
MDIPRDYLGTLGDPMFNVMRGEPESECTFEAQSPDSST